MLDLIRSLDPLDRQVMLLYLEELDAQSIAAIVGLSATNVTIFDGSGRARRRRICPDCRLT